MKVPENVILHIPHSSTVIPFKDGFIADEKVLRNELKLLADWFTDELFDLPFPKVIAPFSRLFCDVERFPDDESEIMSQFGMGICYTHLDNGKMMRNVSPELRMNIKTQFYDPHHKRLEALTGEMLAKYGTVLIIDCHSFEEMPNQRDLNKDTPRPDFCIGTDGYHTPDKLIDKLKENLTVSGFSVEINKPYSGTLIPMKYYHKNKNAEGIVIEVNRRLYMSGNNKAMKSDDFELFKNTLVNLLLKLV